MKNSKNIILMSLLIFGIKSASFASKLQETNTDLSQLKTSENTLASEASEASEENVTKPKAVVENKNEKEPRNCIVQKITTVLNEQLLKDEELQQTKQFFANTLKDAWLDKKIEIEDEDLQELSLTMFNFFVKNTDKEACEETDSCNKDKNKNLLELCTLEDLFKTKVLSILFPELENDLTTVNLSERQWESSYKDEDGNYYSTCSYIYIDLPKEAIEKISKETVENLNALSDIQQLQVLATWIYQQIVYNNI